jgi:hypothetical protein
MLKLGALALSATRDALINIREERLIGDWMQFVDDDCYRGSRSSHVESPFPHSV